MAAQPFLEFRGLANASAGVRVGTDRFLAGCDEQNDLLLYRASAGGEPLASIAVSPWLGLTTRNGEADFEGAARIDDVTFWIGSHARSRSGEKRPDRQRLVALRLRDEDGTPRLELVGKPVTTLLAQMAAAPSLAQFNLAAAAKLEPEKGGGLNIEGLAAGPDRSLLIGFRNPVPEGRALLVPLVNPFAVIEGQPAQLGEPRLLDFGGRGIRDLVWTGREYFVIGGSSGDGGKSHVYRWDGHSAAAERLKVPDLQSMNPEALILFGTPEKPRLLVLSDDGGRPWNETSDMRLRHFRALWVNP